MALFDLLSKGCHGHGHGETAETMTCLIRIPMSLSALSHVEQLTRSRISGTASFDCLNLSLFHWMLCFRLN